MKKGILRKFLTGLLCASMLTVNDGTAVVFAATIENMQEEKDTKETEPVAEDAENKEGQDEPFADEENSEGMTYDIVQEGEAEADGTEENFENAEYTYTLNEDGTATITKYKGEGGEVIIPETIDGHSVSAIGDSAFRLCSGLTNVTIPESVTSIRDYAFSNCSGLTSVKVAGNVISIGESAFSYCSDLTGVTISGSVSGIGDSAFKGCSSLASVMIQGSVTSIGRSAFFDCSSLTSVTIPGSATMIEDLAFHGCSGLTSAGPIGGGYAYEFGWEENIPANAFAGCGLTSVTIPEGITSIGDFAISGCRGLTSVTIPGSVTSIGANAFYYCSGLINVTIPGSVTNIGNSAFHYCSSLTSVTISGSVVSIGRDAFSDCSSLTSVKILGSMTSIGGFAFNSCNGLTSAGPIGGGYAYEFGWKESIPANAFAGCYGLTSVTIPGSVTSIGYSAFSGCSRLTSAGPIGGGYAYEFGWEENIPAYAFSGCSGITSVEIPSSVTSIGESAFSGCSGITSVTLSENVTSIGESAFSGCNGLTSAGPIGGGYAYEFGWKESIPAHAFEGCGITSVEIPGSVTSIGERAFSECDLTSIEIPFGVTSIGDSVFSYGSIMSVKISDSVTSIGDGAFECCDGLTNIRIPSSVTTIGEAAFYDCYDLLSIQIFNAACKIIDPDGGNDPDAEIPMPGDTIAENATIYGYADSTAASYAKQYGRKFVSFESIEALPASLAVSKEKTVYKTGDTLNVDDITATVSYTDGSTKETTDFTTNASALNMSVAGKKALVVTYQEGDSKLEASVEIDVKDASEVVEALPASLTVSKEKTEYKTGDTLNVDDITATVSYTDGSTKTVTAFTTNVSELDMSVAGKKTLVVTYQEGDSKLEASVEINVKDASEIVEPKFYTVTFDANGGTGLSETSRRVEEGKTLDPLPDVKRDGYTCTGWYKEAECRNQWDLSKDTVQSDLTLYAGWKQEETKGDGSGESPFDDAERIDLALAEGMIAGIKAKVYDSMPYEPAVKVVVKENGRKKALLEGTDYRVEYQDNINAGTGSVSVRGVGIYKGKLTGSFTINPKPVKKLKIIAGSMAVGAPDTELPVYVYDGSRLLAESMDYTLSDLSGLTARPAKSAKITINGIGNYTGKTVVKIAVYDTVASQTLSPENVVLPHIQMPYTGKAIKDNEPTVTVGGAVLTKNKDYKVQFQNNKNAGTAFVVVTGKGAYTGKVVTSFEITADRPTLTIADIKAKTYNGKLQKPSVKVKAGSKTLKKNKDYVISYKNNLHTGIATVTVTGRGNYSGIAEQTFMIQPQNIAKISVKGTQSEGLVITYNKRKLKEGKDYTLEYGETNKNKVTVMIKAVDGGDFTGSVTKKVKIL